MGYIVWAHPEYGAWDMEECEDLEEAKKAVLAGLKEGKEVLLTQVLEFNLVLEVAEPKEEKPKKPADKFDAGLKEITTGVKSGAEESKPKDSKDTGG